MATHRFTNAWSQDGGYVLLTHERDSTVTVYSGDSASIDTRLDLGANGANIGVMPDSHTAFVAITGAISVAVAYPPDSFQAD
jgi:Tol biopolymer transport system component